jgi:hypothetical protein
MTVAELIKALEALDPTLPVMTPVGDGGWDLIQEPTTGKVLLNYNPNDCYAGPHMLYEGQDWMNPEGKYVEIQAVLL